MNINKTKSQYYHPNSFQYNGRVKSSRFVINLVDQRSKGAPLISNDSSTVIHFYRTIAIRLKLHCSVLSSF